MHREHKMPAKDTPKLEAETCKPRWESALVYLPIPSHKASLTVFVCSFCSSVCIQYNTQKQKSGEKPLPLTGEVKYRRSLERLWSWLSLERLMMKSSTRRRLASKLLECGPLPPTVHPPHVHQTSFTWQVFPGLPRSSASVCVLYWMQKKRRTKTGEAWERG